jgi:hypothetical protein
LHGGVEMRKAKEQKRPRQNGSCRAFWIPLSFLFAIICWCVGCFLPRCLYT